MATNDGKQQTGNKPGAESGRNPYPEIVSVQLRQAASLGNSMMVGFYQAFGMDLDPATAAALGAAAPDRHATPPPPGHGTVTGTACTCTTGRSLPKFCPP